MNNETFVVIEDVVKYYPGNVLALNHVSCYVPRGQWVSIMGPSGSGKTTLLNIISGLDKPSQGLVMVDGRNISQLNSHELASFRRETVGLVFQQFHLIPYLNALENVMLAQYFHSIVDEQEAKQALERVGLGDRWHHLPSQLSGGERQRVCIARALINEPNIILADEPTGNLDRENEEVVMELFQELHKEGHTLVVVTHDPEIATRGQRIIRLDHSSIAEDSLILAGQRR